MFYIVAHDEIIKEPEQFNFFKIVPHDLAKSEGFYMQLITAWYFYASPSPWCKGGDILFSSSPGTS